MKVFALFDKVANKFVSTTLAESEEMFVRTSLFAICMDYPIKDVDFYCVGYFDDDLGIIRPCRPRLCSWDCYKHPTTRMAKDKFLSLEEIEQAAKQKKNEFIHKQKDSIKDLENLKKLYNDKLSTTKDKKEKYEQTFLPIQPA